MHGPTMSIEYSLLPDHLNLGHLACQFVTTPAAAPPKKGENIHLYLCMSCIDVAKTCQKSARNIAQVTMNDSLIEFCQRPETNQNRSERVKIEIWFKFQTRIQSDKTTNTYKKEVWGKQIYSILKYFKSAKRFSLFYFAGLAGFEFLSILKRLPVLSSTFSSRNFSCESFQFHMAVVKNTQKSLRLKGLFSLLMMMWGLVKTGKSFLTQEK